MPDQAKWTKRLFWLVLILGCLLIVVNVTYGVQNLDASRRLKLDKDWMDQQMKLNIAEDARIKRLENLAHVK